MERFLLWPVPASTVVTQWFGERFRDYSTYGLYAHNGIDISALRGSRVLATHEGQVWSYDDEGYGQTIEIWYPQIGKDALFKTIYAHLSLQVAGNQSWVRAGQVIGEVGSTGNSTGPHLHYSLKWLDGRNPGYRDWVDAHPFLLEK